MDRFVSKADAGFLFLITLYIALSYAVAASHGLAAQFHLILYLKTSALLTTGILLVYIFWLVLKIYYIIIFIRPPKLMAFLRDMLLQGPLNKERYIQALPVFIGFVFFFSTFSSMKMMIPAIHPFSWDPSFAALDRIIHLGQDPWRILQPLLGYPTATALVNAVYNFWLASLFIVLYWQLFSLQNPQARMQFFYAYVLTWAVNGTFLAILFSSAGPCFFERVTGSSYYEPLMNYLREANHHYKIFSLPTQDLLWQKHSANGNMIGGGISAMPSVHVSTALLFLLLARKLKTRLWPLFAVFFLFIFTGSIHLAWHYAADGYLAILTTLALWPLAGKMALAAEKRQS